MLHGRSSQQNHTLFAFRAGNAYGLMGDFPRAWPVNITVDLEKRTFIERAVLSGCSFYLHSVANS